MLKNNQVKTAEVLTENLLKLMKIEKYEIKCSLDKEIINLDINSPDQGILIGTNGETIFGLQLILALMLYKKTGVWQRLIVNVGNFLQTREENLKKMALNLSQRVKFSGQEVVIPHLNSAERRIVHMALAQDSSVSTESVGEGRERRLVIKPKKQETEDDKA